MANATVATDGSAPIGARQWYALIVLTAIYACHSLDRAVVSVVIEPLKHELHLSDSSVGVLTGLGYGIFYGLAALPLGALVDRVNRVRLMTILVTVWSGMTAFAGAATGFWGVLFARMGVGAAEAGGQPTALSILADLFPEKRRASALGIFYLGTSIGYGASFLIGGVVAAVYGWRAAFFMAGLPGLLFGLILFFTVAEPPRSSDRDEKKEQAPPFGVTLRHLASLPAVRHLYLAMMLAAFSVSTLLMWMVPLLMREHHLSLSQAGIVAGLVMGVAQAIGAVIAGSMADRVARKGLYRRTWVPATALLLSVPLAEGAALAPTDEFAIACMLGFGLFTSAWTAAGYTAMMGEVDSRMRGTMLGGLQLITTLLGSALSPFLTGLLSDRIGGPHSLAWAIAILSLVGLWAATHFLLGGRAIRRRELAAAG